MQLQSEKTFVNNDFVVKLAFLHHFSIIYIFNNEDVVLFIIVYSGQKKYSRRFGIVESWYLKFSSQ